MKRTNIEKKQIDLIKESICVYTTCIECRTLYKDGKLCFTSIEDFIDDRGRSCLFRLKEMCHELFRNSDEATYKEKLYDMTVGYIFHEAMILRENLYQLEYYRPKSDMASNELTNQERKIVHEIEMLIKKADKKLKDGLRETKMLIKELVGQLKDLIKLYENNYLLPRFIFENEKSLTKIYGKKGFEELLDDMYKDGKILLMFKAAKSYLESEYYETARILFKKVASLDNQNKTALFLYIYASAFYFYFRNRFARALVLAEKATSMDINNDKEIDSYKASLKGLISDVSKEAKRIKKHKEEI
ncbi:MAG: hypothetical protein NTU90_07385 [Proteobacteria bacterium]|nr:hypothetical protein [Pseudomonadota bacterium]